MQCGWARWNKHAASRPELQALDQASGGGDSHRTGAVLFFEFFFVCLTGELFVFVVLGWFGWLGGRAPVVA